MLVSCTIGLTTGFFKLILRDPRPYFHDEDIILYDCETGYGNPSGHSIAAVSLYLTLFKEFTQNLKINPNINLFLKFVLGCFISAILFSRLALGAHSINQIFLGAFVGFMIYIFYFHVIEMDMKPEVEIHFIMNKTILKIFSFIISTCIFIGFIIFNFVPDANVNKNDYLFAIQKFCPGTSYSKSLEYEAYFMLSSSSSLLGIYLGIYFDLKQNYEGDEEVWLAINDGVDKNKIFDMNKTKQIRWNDTNLLTSFKRLFIVIFSNVITYVLNFIVSSKSHTNYVFILKNFLPNGLTGFMLFGLTRQICLYCGLGNKVYLKDSYINKLHIHLISIFTPIYITIFKINFIS